MDIVQLNLALSANADRIREPKFNTVKRGGYDPDQVLEYLSKVADRVQALEEQARQLDSKRQDALQELDEALATKAQTPETYESLSPRVAEMMVGLDKDVARIRGEAQADAERILEEARTEASEIQTQAERMQTVAQQTLMQAQTEAERATAAFRSRQGSVRSELRATCSQVLQMISNLEEAIGPEQGEEPIVLEEGLDEAASKPIAEPAPMPDPPR
jgi:DivIVA domain-containing protein